jgi:hypothetical protein
MCDFWVPSETLDAGTIKKDLPEMVGLFFADSPLV